jgi:hypothetical protein
MGSVGRMWEDSGRFGPGPARSPDPRRAETYVAFPQQGFVEP